jgi:hypothetical protein
MLNLNRLRIVSLAFGLLASFLVACATFKPSPKNGVVVVPTPQGLIMCQDYEVTSCGVNYYDCGPQKIQARCMTNQVIFSGENLQMPANLPLPPVKEPTPT